MNNLYGCFDVSNFGIILTLGYFISSMQGSWLSFSFLYTSKKVQNFYKEEGESRVSRNNVLQIAKQETVIRKTVANWVTIADIYPLSERSPIRLKFKCLAKNIF